MPSGAYLLRIAVSQPCNVSFGSFRKGKPIPVPAGDYLYVGSAMGSTGSTCLSGRLLRHATRSGDRPPQELRLQMQRCFLREGLLPAGNSLPAQKSLHWHVDYLLDETAAVLRQAFVFRSKERLEAGLARWLLDEPETFLLARGLGASDSKAPAHLLGARGSPHWWITLPRRLEESLETGNLVGAERRE